MSKSLSQLAERVARQSGQLLVHRDSAAKLADLQSRLDQLTGLNGQLKMTLDGMSLILDIDPKLRVPRKRLSPRLKNLQKLEEKIALDPTAIIPNEALDIVGFREAIDDVKDELLKRWGDFVKPERSVQGWESLGDDKEVADTVSKLRSARAELETRQKKLPSKKSEIEEVRNIKKRLELLANQLLAYGYDEEILAFLNKARDSHGVTFADAVKNPKVRKWLEEGKHAAHFRIVHESTLSNWSLFRK